MQRDSSSEPQDIDFDYVIRAKENEIRADSLASKSDIILETQGKNGQSSTTNNGTKDKQAVGQSRTTRQQTSESGQTAPTKDSGRVLGVADICETLNENVPSKDVWDFINVLRSESIVDIPKENIDDNESVISEAGESTFQNISFLNHISGEMEEVNCDNNVVYDVSRIGLGKTYIGGASRYPPRLDGNRTLGAYHADLGTCTNVAFEHGRVKHDLNDQEIEELPESQEDSEGRLFVSDTNNEIIDEDGQKTCVIHAVNAIEFVETKVQEEVEHVLVGDEVVIKNRTDKWHVHVPIRDQHGNVEWIYLFADPGANVGCVKSSWAWKHYRDYVRLNRRKSGGIKTPGGVVIPKFVLWMTFPSISGKILKVRMYLVDELPVDILADINMLKAFGYSFIDETPPFFRHQAEPDIDLELKEPEEQFKITDFERYQQGKQSYQGHAVANIEQVDMHTTLWGGDVLLYSSENKRDNLFSDTPTVTLAQNSKILTKDEIEFYYQRLRDIEKAELQLKLDIQDLECGRNYHNCNILLYHPRGLIDVNNIDYSKTEPVQLEEEYYNQDIINQQLKFVNTALGINSEDSPEFIDPKIDSRGNLVDKARVWHKCMLINAKQSFLAGQAEIENAIKQHKNEELKFNNLDYLKTYPSKYGKRFNGLYEGVTKLVAKYRHVFATHQFSRRTMKVEPARLGINPKFRGKTMFASQYPINEAKRRDMINYTIENENNGFWHPIKFSLHCVPYTMVPKRRHGVIYRYRPAFDGRIVNQYCDLMEANMPTIKDIDDLHSIPGFVTCADVKNCFDCIPLDKRDWEYAVCMTPLGLYQMTCLTYGWMNAAPEAQKIMNKLALSVGNTLAYIDDIAVKHPIEGNTQDICDSIERLFSYCDIHNIQLHPGKFYPACTESEGFSFVRTLEGSRVGEPYIKKVLALAKPTTVKQLQEFIGVIGYIGRFIYHKALLTYWLNDLVNKADGKGKLKWTREADLAYEQLCHLVANSPLLYNPTKDGEFCVKTDACNYGIGAVLYQNQKHPETGEERWVIVDMWSKTMPTQLRHCHSMVHEAYAIVHAMEHWQFYLLKRKFILSTDNNPVAHIFTHKYRDINPITQRQLLRLRTKVGMFTFESYHVPGIDNELADSLSRFTSELLDRQGQPRMIQPWISEDTNEKPLTQDDIAALDAYLAQGKQLKAKHQHLSMDKSFHTVTNLMCMDHDSMYQSYKKDQNANWLNLLHDYRNTANYLETPRIRQYLDSAHAECVQFNEFDDPSFISLREDVINIAQCIAQLPNNNISNIACTVQQFQANDIEHIYQQKQAYTDQLAQIHHNLLPARQDDIPRSQVYNPEEDLGALPASERVAFRTPGVVTRSMAKRQRNKARLKQLKRSKPDSNDPLVKQKEKELMEGVYDHLNAEFNRTRFRAKTREDFLSDIFGHRENLDIFKLDQFIVYQNSSAVINAAKKVVSTKGGLNINTDEFQYLMQYDPELAAKIESKQARIDTDTGVFQVKHEVSKHDGAMWLNVVPFTIRGKLMDYAHHNLQLHHFEHNQTYDQLKRKYWWGTMKSDVRKFCETCISCQFIKGSVRHRAPLRIRELPSPRAHVFADFLGPIYKKYYIFVMVDYATGYTMLIPTTNTDVQEIVDAIINNWVKIFGWFDIFESDWGSGFNSKVFEALTRAAKIKLELAEPRNHRSIGKVERTIGFLQSIINQYNVLLNQELIANQTDSIERAWEIIQIILPFIQLSMNQHRSRFTAISPNMLMLGSNVRDASELGDLCKELKKVKIDVDINSRDYLYVEMLFKRIRDLNQIFKNDWKEYCRVSRNAYDKRWSITTDKIKRNKRHFKPGKKVLYFIGDKETAQRKWRRKWSGPWIVDKHLNDSTVIIKDPDSGNDKRVSFDRIKVFRERDVGYYTEYFQDDDLYQMHYNRTKELLYQRDVKFRKDDVNLDYNQPEVLKQNVDKK